MRGRAQGQPYRNLPYAHHGRICHDTVDTNPGKNYSETSKQRFLRQTGGCLVVRKGASRLQDRPRSRQAWRPGLSLQSLRLRAVNGQFMASAGKAGT
jgi:hypothetical protein